MPIIVTCENCSARHRIRGAPKDRRLKCKNCGKMLFIPRVDDSQRPLEDNHDFNLRDEASRAGALQLIKQLNETQSAETPASAPLGKRVVGFLFTSVLSCLMVGVVWWAMGYLLTAWSSSFWPHVEGTIVNSDVVRAGKSSRAVIKYRYVVNSATYTSDGVTVIADSSAVWGGAYAVSSRFPQGAQVPVYYNPKSPDSAALITGIPGMLLWLLPLIPLACFVVGYGNYSCFLTLIGKPLSARPHDPNRKPLNERVNGIVTGVCMLVVGFMFGTMLVMTCSTAPRMPGGGSSVGLWFLDLFLVPFTGLFGWLGIKILINAFTPPVKASVLQNEPEAPRYSESSLICLMDTLGVSMATAVIVDHDAGMIHFRKCFRPTGVVFKAVPWFSGPLSSVSSVSQMTFKGVTTLTIQMPDGQAAISSTASNFAALLSCFANVEKTLDPGQKPLDWQTCVILGGCVVGLVLGFMQPVSPRSSDIFLFLNPIFGVLVCGGASGLFVWAVGEFKKKK